MIEQVQHDSSHRSQVLYGIACPGLVRVFTEGLIKLPVASVFDLPVRPSHRW